MPTPPKALAMAPQSAFKLLYSIQEIATMLSVSRRTIERVIEAEEFPDPDKVIGTRMLWRLSTINAWIDIRDKAATRKAPARRRKPNVSVG